MNSTTLGPFAPRETYRANDQGMMAIGDRRYATYGEWSYVCIRCGCDEPFDWLAIATPAYALCRSCAYVERAIILPEELG